MAANESRNIMLLDIMLLWLFGKGTHVVTGVIIFLFLAGVLPLTLMVWLLFPDLPAHVALAHAALERVPHALLVSCY